MSYLSQETLERLRQCVKSSKWPINYNKWPIELNTCTNCLAFALGLSMADTFYNIYTVRYSPFSKLEDLIEYLLNISSLEYRKIDSFDEAENDEFIIQARKTDTSNFHVIRRNLDGTWVHKKGWYNAPTQITNWKYIDSLYPIIAATFAVKKKAS